MTYYHSYWAITSWTSCYLLIEHSVSFLILHHSIMYQSLAFICVILATASAQEDPCYREGTNCYKY